jgi:hypothetical protein
VSRVIFARRICKESWCGSAFDEVLVEEGMVVSGWLEGKELVLTHDNGEQGLSSSLAAKRKWQAEKHYYYL